MPLYIPDRTLNPKHDYITELELYCGVSFGQKRALAEEITAIWDEEMNQAVGVMAHGLVNENLGLKLEIDRLKSELKSAQQAVLDRPLARDGRFYDALQAEADTPKGDL